MLVSNNVFNNRYVWDGSQTNFPISFPFLDNNHIQVWYAQPGQPDTNAVILGKENYTITGAGNPAGGGTAAGSADTEASGVGCV